MLPVNIGGVNFDDTFNIDLPGVNLVGNQNTTGNAASASQLNHSLTINDVVFNGSEDHTVTLSGGNDESDNSTEWVIEGVYNQLV